jgi:hypothetical protein
MATPDNGIAAILYNSSEVTAKVGEGKGSDVTLKQITNYPFDEHIKIEVHASKECGLSHYTCAFLPGAAMQQLPLMAMRLMPTLQQDHTYE